MSSQQYKKQVVSLMSYLDDIDYPADTTFSQERLAEITPIDITRYFLFRLYGNPDISLDNDEKPKHRCTTVLYWKKAISFFMPNNNNAWVETAKIGNPTRSAAIARVINHLKKKETARCGAASQARRAFVEEEFRQIVHHLEDKTDKEFASWGSAFTRYQFAMISRVDDVAKLRKPDLFAFQQYPEYGICTKLCWSNNAVEERDAPTQLLLGAEDPDFCVLTAMGAWLEINFELRPEENEFYFGLNGCNNPNSIKSRYSEAVRFIVESESFHPRNGCRRLGTHSNQKFAVAEARSSACSKDEVDHRGRCKSDTRQQNTHASVTIPYVDAKVAAKLCKGGPITYQHGEGSGITDDWLLHHVVPNMRHFLEREVCIVFGRALLWRIFYEEQHGRFVHRQIVERVMKAYRELGNRNSLGQFQNPITKRPLGVTGNDAQLLMDIIMMENAEDRSPTRRDDGIENGMQGEEVRLLASQVAQLRQSIADIANELERRDLHTQQILQKINRNISRLVATPARRQVGSRNNRDTNAAGGVKLARLSKNPRTLHNLWTEWEFGLDGNKPAKEFVASERGGKNKHKFYLRKFFWNRVCIMIRSGKTARVACDEIYSVYGERTPVTQILRQMQIDEKNGGNPALGS